MKRFAGSVLLGGGAGTLGYFMGDIAVTKLSYPPSAPWALLLILWISIVGYGIVSDVHEGDESGDGDG